MSNDFAMDVPRPGSLFGQLEIRMQNPGSVGIDSRSGAGITSTEKSGSFMVWLTLDPGANLICLKTNVFQTEAVNES